jgi:hypothetical protein
VRFALVLVMCFGVAEAEERAKAVATCKRVLLASVPSADIRLVGRVTSGKQKLALVAHKTNHVLVRKGECIGKERVPFENLEPQQPLPPFEIPPRKWKPRDLRASNPPSKLDEMPHDLRCAVP